MQILVAILLALASASYETCIKACGPPGTPTYRQCSLACSGQRKRAEVRDYASCIKACGPRTSPNYRTCSLACGGQKKKVAVVAKDYKTCLQACGPARASMTYRKCELDCRLNNTHKKK